MDVDHRAARQFVDDVRSMLGVVSTEGCHLAVKFLSSVLLSLRDMQGCVPGRGNMDTLHTMLGGSPSAC